MCVCVLFCLLFYVVLCAFVFCFAYFSMLCCVCLCFVLFTFLCCVVCVCVLFCLLSYVVLCMFVFCFVVFCFCCCCSIFSFLCSVLYINVCPFFGPSYCLSFDLKLLITPLASSNFFSQCLWHVHSWLYIRLAFSNDFLLEQFLWK